MKRMTPATKLLLFVLKGKYKYFSERRMLANDGSFYCIDKSLMEQLGIGDNTIRRARIFLKEAADRKNYIEKNVFLKLPFSKSVIFSRGKLTCIANHEFLFDKKERDRLISVPFENISQ